MGKWVHMVLGTLTVEGITESQEDGIISILWCDDVSPSGISGISGISRISGITKRGAIGLSHGCMPREKKKDTVTLILHATLRKYPRWRVFE